MSISMLARVVTVAVAVWLLSGCGVQRMQMGEQEVKSEWGSMLFLANEQLDVVTKAWPSVGTAETAKKIDAAREKLRASMNKWQDIPSGQDLISGVEAIADGRRAVDEVMAAAKVAGADGQERVAEEIALLRTKSSVAQARYEIAARTYNDILRLYPSKWMAKLLGKGYAMSFDSRDTENSMITDGSLLERLHAAQDR